MPRRKARSTGVAARRRLARRRRCSCAAAPRAGASGSTSTSRTARCVSLADGSPEAERLLPLARELLGAALTRRAELARARSRERAYLEGDFLLRSGRRSQLLPRQVPLRDAARAARGARRARSPRPSREHEPDAERLAGPELGAVALAAAASLAGGLPFLIVRERGEGLRHREPDRGRVRARRAGLPGRGRRHLRRRCARGRRGAARSRPRVSRRRSASSTGRRAGSTRSRATAVRLRPLLLGPRSSSRAEKRPQIRMVEPISDRRC